MRLIHLINSTFLSLKIIVNTDRCWELRNIKHQNKHITLFSDANVPVRFRAQQRAKYSSLQLTANCIAAKRCLWHYFKLIWESPTTEDTNFPSTGALFHSKLESNGLRVDRNRKFSERIFSTPAIFKAISKLFGSLGCSDDKSWLDVFSLRFVDFRCKFSFHEKQRSSQVWQ